MGQILVSEWELEGYLDSVSLGLTTFSALAKTLKQLSNVIKWGGSVHLANRVFACAFIFVAFLFCSLQATATELTDTEIGQFRALLEEKRLTPPGKADPLTDKDTTILKGLLEQFKGVKFGGYVNNYIQYESVSPGAGDSIAIPPLLFTRQVNSFTVKEIKLSLYKEAPEPGDIGFKISLNWGDMARRGTPFGPVHDDAAIQPNPPGAPTGARQTTFTEAYVLWNIPVGKGLKAKFGKFFSWLGFEIWGSPWNPNYTISYASSQGSFGNATGLALGYDVTDRFSAHYYLTNTTGTFVNNNKILPMVLS